MPATGAEQDVVFNKHSVALAKSRRLLESWLPAASAQDFPGNPKSDSDIEREEAEIFAPVPDLLGLGAAPPPVLPNGSFQRQALGSNDALRKQLLSPADYKRYGLVEKRSGLTLMAGSKPRPVEAKQVPAEEEDEEEGRSGVGRGKRKREKVGGEREATGEGGGEEGGKEDAGGEGQEEVFGSREEGTGGKKTKEGRKGTGSYLDEILQEKARKSKKKKKKKKNRVAGT